MLEEASGFETMTDDPEATAAAIVKGLHDEGDPVVRAELGRRYGIHTDRAVGITMARMKAIAAPHRPNHGLALALWASGLYEARTIAAHIDDPELVDVDQMNDWCSDFDNWALVDTVCFTLFDKAPAAWSMVEPWANNDGEFTKRAGFALLWALALHDKSADDERFGNALALIDANASDPRHLVGKAQTMALRAIVHKRPKLLTEVDAIVRRLAASDDAPTRRVVRPIARMLAQP
ncbi:MULTISPECIES: DNA alkylation repair protein [Arthrobacter]|uniref:DNA alkylation repair protein n=1 Tax=Arthrobacter oryzae TaxID=409290 RepID=A0A3N0BSH8_9MICC|nr:MULTISPECIES: DNA alkylation repair protein [Arthrobacter]QYF90069.1 DNA alkylation repair protein [Arthrobacter sp. PAMC25284]RNL52033.1 DNA alkylation repair protein [Arthrobacter oryzae]